MNPFEFGRSRIEKIRPHTEKILLFIGLVSVGIIGYEVGLVRALSDKTSPISIEVVEPKSSQEKTSYLPVSVLGESVVSEKTAPANCLYVGSKNSTLYHLPKCAAARRIKNENKRCFTSKEDAESKGYRPGCLK